MSFPLSQAKAVPSGRYMSVKFGVKVLLGRSDQASLEAPLDPWGSFECPWPAQGTLLGGLGMYGMQARIAAGFLGNPYRAERCMVGAKQRGLWLQIAHDTN